MSLELRQKSLTMYGRYFIDKKSWYLGSLCDDGNGLILTPYIIVN